jgi:acetyl esterase
VDADEAMTVETSPGPTELDPEIAGCLSLLAQEEPRTLADRRRRMDELTEVLGGPAQAGVEVAETSFEGVPGRVYRPASSEPGAAVFLHGGGWVAGSLDSHDRICRAIALGSQTKVVSVRYRLAPEHPWPAALEDSETVVRAVAREHEPIALVGDSAGGNLAAVLARRLRAVNEVRLALQVLVYPICDYAMDTSSYRGHENASLTRAEMVSYFDAYLPSGADPSHPDISPARASDLRGLAPALVAVASHDLLRDEGLEYARRLKGAGVPVDVVDCEGTVHGFLRWNGRAAKARWLQRRIAQAIGGKRSPTLSN